MKRIFHWLLANMIVVALTALAIMGLITYFRASWATLPMYGIQASIGGLVFFGGVFLLVLYALLRGINQHMGKKKVENDLHVATVQIELQERQRYLVKDESYQQLTPPLSGLLSPQEYSAGYQQQSPIHITQRQDGGNIVQRQVRDGVEVNQSIRMVPEETRQKILHCYYAGVSPTDASTRLNLTGRNYWMIKDTYDIEEIHNRK